MNEEGKCHFLTTRDWRFPINEIVDKVYESFSSMEAEKFQMALGTIMREWHFLSLIWERLQQEYRERTESLEEFLNLKKKGISRLIGSELTKKFMHNSNLMHLDTEDFFIHAKILLDRVVFLTKEFFADRVVRKGNKPPNGFTKFRKWFTDEKYSSRILDTKLAEYLKSNTDWYDKLKYARDKLIEHKKGYYIDVLREEDKRIVIGMARPRFDSVKNIINWCKVEDMPDLGELMDGITHFLHFYDQHFSTRIDNWCKP